LSKAPVFVSISQYPIREASDALKEDADFGIQLLVAEENVFGESVLSKIKQVLGLNIPLDVPTGKSDGRDGSKL